MKVPVLDITHYSRDKDTGIIETGGEKLNNIIQCDVRVGVETIKDVFSIKIPNTLQDDGTWSRPVTKKEDGANFISEGDYLKIKAYYNTPDTKESNNVLIFGEVTNFSYNNGPDGPMITVDGTNVTENLLKGFAIAGKKVTDVTSTPPGIIKEVLSRLNQSGLPATKKVYAAETDEVISDPSIRYGDSQSGVTNITGSFGNIAGSQSDGTAFPNKTYSKTWQPVYKILEDVSTPEYTGDSDAGNYIFYIKTTPVQEKHKWKLDTEFINELVFKAPSQSTDSVLNRGEDYSSITTKKDIEEVVNVLIVKPGTDARGQGITTFVTNAESLGEVGPKYDFWSKPEIGNVIRKDEREEGTTLGSDFTGDLPKENGSNYPWTFNTIFNREDFHPFNEFSGSPQVASDQDEYNEILRQEIRIRGKIEAKRIVDNLGEARFNSNVELQTGSNNIQMGNIVELRDKTSGWEGTDMNPGYKLRVRDIRHRFDDSGWSTTLVCKEDEKVLSEKING